MTKNKRLIIVLLIMGISLICGLGLTFAYLAPIINGVEISSTVAFNSGTISITYKGSDNIIYAENIIPGWSQTKTFTLTGINNTTLNDEGIMDYGINLVVETNTFSDNSLTYSLTGKSTNSNDKIYPLSGEIPTGTNTTKIGTGRFVQDNNIKQEVVHTYTLTISFPNKETSQNSNLNASFKAYISVSEDSFYMPPTASETLAGLADTSDNRMEVDDFGNIRYNAKSGSWPNNYVKFNDETWRIIGVFDVGAENKSLKIIREYDSNFNYTIDTSYWPESNLQKYLNGDYYNSLTDEAKSQIYETTWYLGGTTTPNQDAASLYKIERGLTSSSYYVGAQTTWTGKIGIMYLSDYRYAGYFNSSYYNWLFESDIQLTIVPLIESYDNINTNKIVTIASGSPDTEFDDWVSVGYSYNYRPCLYLDPSISIVDGDGTKDNPYILLKI